MKTIVGDSKAEKGENPFPMFFLMRSIPNVVKLGQHHFYILAFWDTILQPSQNYLVDLMVNAVMLLVLLIVDNFFRNTIFRMIFLWKL